VNGKEELMDVYYYPSEYTELIVEIFNSFIASATINAPDHPVVIASEAFGRPITVSDVTDKKEVVFLIYNQLSEYEKLMVFEFYLLEE
jgi:hypothetical protein